MIKVQGISSKSGVAITSGISSTNKLIQSYPLSTITVYDTGTTNLTPIFTDAAGTIAKANPFTAGSDASFGFYVAAGRYDLRFSGTGITTPFTLSDINVGDAGEIPASVYTSLAAAVADIGATPSTLVISTALFPNGGNVTVPATLNLRFVGAGTLNITTGQTVIILSDQSSYPIKKLFYNANAGQGTVLFHAAPVNDDGVAGVSEAYSQWWGAVTTADTIASPLVDCAPAIQSAVNSGARRVIFPSGAYGFNSPVTQTANNVRWTGQSRGPYTDFAPMRVDISVGGGKNAMIINGKADSTPVFSMEHIRFTSDIAFTGYAINAQDNALYSSEILDCWVSMGQSSTGFFKGGMSDCFVNNLDVENTRVGFNAQGTFAGNTFTNIHALSCNDALFYTQDMVSNNNKNLIDTVFVTAQIANIAFVVKNAQDWTMNNIQFDCDSGGTAASSFATFDTCTGLILSNFQVRRQSGNLGGILLNAVNGRVVNGVIVDPRSVTGIEQAIKITGASNVDIDQMKITGGTVPHVGVSSSGSVRISHSRLDGSASTAIVSTMPATANITIRDSELVNANSGAGPIVDVNTSGNFYFITNTIGVDDGVSTPTAYFKLTGSGATLIDGNIFLGGLNLVAGGSTQLLKLGRSFGIATTFFATAMPSTGSWKQGDIVQNLLPIQISTTTVTGITNANPAVFTAARHGLVNGQTVTIAGATGTLGTAVNGSRVVTVLSSDTFSIPVDTTATSSFTSATVSANKYTLFGWIRLTTGSGNVLNTDWMEIRTLTGN